MMKPSPTIDTPAQEAEIFTISQLAKEFDLTTRAIRFYEDEGLITPSRNGRTRIYSFRDHTRLRLVLRGKRLGFSLGEIREMFELYDSAPGEAGQLKHILKIVDDRKRSLQQQMLDINMMLSDLSDFEQQCRQRLVEMEG